VSCVLYSKDKKQSQDKKVQIKHREQKKKVPVGERLSTPVQTGPGAHPAFYIMGSGLFLGVKRSGRGVNHPPPSSAEVKERVDLHLYSLSGPSWSVTGRTLPLLVFIFLSCNTPNCVSSLLRFLDHTLGGTPLNE
jgi:hypothetical protein